MSDWNTQTFTANASKHTRSWRQQLYTDFGSDFKLIAHMEDLTILDNGEVVHTPRPDVVRYMSQVYTDPDVLLINEALTRLIKKWMDEDNAPPPEVIPEPIIEPMP